MKITNVVSVYSCTFRIILVWVLAWFISYLTYHDWGIGEYQAYLIAKKTLIEKYDEPKRCGGNFENHIYPSWSRSENVETHEVTYGNIRDNDGNYLFSSDNGTCNVTIRVGKYWDIWDGIIDN